MEKYEKFWLWVERTMHERGMTIRAVERKAGLSNAVISARMRKRTAPTDTVYDALSEVFGVSRRELLALAGDIQSVDDLIGNDEYMQLHETLKRMTPGEVGNVIRYIRFQFPDLYKAAVGDKAPTAD